MEGQLMFLFIWILHVAQTCDYSLTFPTLNGSDYTAHLNENISLPFTLTSDCDVPDNFRISVATKAEGLFALICLMKLSNGSCHSANRTCSCESKEGEYVLTKTIKSTDNTTWVWWKDGDHKRETKLVFNVLGDATEINHTTPGQQPDDSGDAEVTSTWEKSSRPQTTHKSGKSDGNLLDNLAAAGVGALVMASFGVAVIVVCKRCKRREGRTTGRCKERPAWRYYHCRTTDAVVPEQLARDYSDVVDTVENTAVDESGAAQAVVVVVNDDDGDFTSRVTLVNEQNQPADSLSQHAAPPMDLPALFGADTGGPRDYVSVSKIRDAKRRAMDETQC